MRADKLICQLAQRQPDSHKGDYGKILLVAGSRGMCGAAVLSAMSALRTGSGLVKVAVPNEIMQQVAVGNPCLMTAGLSQDLRGRLSA